MKPTILITGSAGQVGAELTPLLRERYGADHVVAATHLTKMAGADSTGPTVQLDVSRKDDLAKVMKDYKVDTVYHLASLLSAVGEKNPELAWNVNMQGLKNLLDLSRELGVSRLFWPSSVAVFGADAPRTLTPQNAPLNPTTMYGVTKVAGELLCNYYNLKFGLDVRCLRYPGLISNVAKAGGGTTDYAVEIFYAAIESGAYRCFVRQDTMLPMMYMPDALRATVDVMEAKPSDLKRHNGYNLAAISFTAGELAGEIGTHIPNFRCEYVPDSRQAIADGWPQSIDDREARRDWGWMPRYDLSTMTADMIVKLSARLKR